MCTRGGGGGGAVGMLAGARARGRGCGVLSHERHRSADRGRGAAGAGKSRPGSPGRPRRWGPQSAEGPAPRSAGTNPAEHYPGTGRILGYVAQKRIPRASSPPATPRFLWLPSLRLAQRDTYTPVPVVSWCSRRASQPTHSGGQTWVHHDRVARAKKRIFPKLFLDHLGCSNKRF